MPAIDTVVTLPDGLVVQPGPSRPDVVPIPGVDAFLEDGALRCGGMTRSLRQSRAQVLLVVDSSGSMGDRTTDGQRKWGALLNGFRTVLPTVQSRLSTALLTYPRSELMSAAVEDSCGVSTELAVAFSFNNADEVNDRLGEIAPFGSTPTAAALQQAYDILQTIPDELGRRYLVLATDGAPNCNGTLPAPMCRCTNAAENCEPTNSRFAAYSCLDDERTLGVLRNLASRGVQTFVMGLAGTGSFTDVLNAMAVAGGRPRTGTTQYYSAESSSEITAALNAITSGLANCFFDLDMAPPDPDLVDLRVGRTSLGRDPNRRNGWFWAEGSGYRRIEFYGATCDRVRAGSGGEPLVAAFGCPAAPAPP